MSGAGQTLYLKLDQNSIVREPAVRVEDVAKAECADAGILRKVKALEIYHFHCGGRKQCTGSHVQVISVLDIIEEIQKICPALEIVSLGAPDFVVRYEPVPEKSGAQLAKTAFLCVVLFFGSAFTIMTFIQDVSVGEVFDRFYTRVTGAAPEGITALEIAFCIGLAFGIIFFYNHIGGKKLLMIQPRSRFRCANMSRMWTILI
ncbi:MAG: stage V sporulation protein AA [Clostridiales bacterium]|nr:stage V sporulation protein AA [Clostridiales bacterium]